MEILKRRRRKTFPVMTRSVFLSAQSLQLQLRNGMEREVRIREKGKQMRVTMRMITTVRRKK